MTKKHYEAIAEILFHPNNSTIDYIKLASREISEDLADYFATDNPRFNRTRFLTACGVEQEQECAVCDAPLSNKKCPFGC